MILTNRRGTYPEFGKRGIVTLVPGAYTCTRPSILGSSKAQLNQMSEKSPKGYQLVIKHRRS